MTGGEFGDDAREPEELDAADLETTDAAWDGPGSSRRGGSLVRWLLLLAVIAVVALVVQQLQPGPDPSAAPTPTGSARTTSAAATPTERAGIAPSGPVRASSDGRSIEGTVSLSRLGSVLPGNTQDWSLFARGDHVVARLDFGRGELTTTTLPTLQSSGPVTFIATDAGAIVRPLDSVTGYLVPDGQQARELTGLLAEGGPVVPGPDPSHVWVDLGDSDSGVVRLSGVDGRPAGHDIPLPDNASGWILPDGGGRPLVLTTGGVYDVRRDGLRRVTTGVVLASGPTGWLVSECDARNVCSAKVVDRRSGQRRSLPGFPHELDRASGTLSPDGTRVALVADHGAAGSALWLVDLRSGRVDRIDLRSLPAPYPGSGSVVWAPDGRWVFAVDLGGQVRAVDAATGRVRSLAPHLPDVTQLAVRPG